MPMKTGDASKGAKETPTVEGGNESNVIGPTSMMPRKTGNDSKEAKEDPIVESGNEEAHWNDGVNEDVGFLRAIQHSNIHERELFLWRAMTTKCMLFAIPSLSLPPIPEISLISPSY